MHGYTLGTASRNTPWGMHRVGSRNNNSNQQATHKQEKADATEVGRLQEQASRKEQSTDVQSTQIQSQQSTNEQET